MLKAILPENLKYTRFGQGEMDCSYNPDGDFISFRRKEILGDTNFNHIWQMYFHRRLSRKEILITSLLHELGHRKFYLENGSFCKKQREKEAEQFTRKYNLNGITKWNLSYWQEITSEREAMNFAKEYFFRYIIRSIINKVMKGDK